MADSAADGEENEAFIREDSEETIPGPVINVSESESSDKVPGSAEYRNPESNDQPVPKSAKYRDSESIEELPKSARYRDPDSNSPANQVPGTPTYKNPVTKNEADDKQQNQPVTRLQPPPAGKKKARVIPVREITPGDVRERVTWDRSPYTYNPGRGREYSWVDKSLSSRSPNSVDLDLSDDGNPSKTRPEDTSVLNIVPPIGHFGDFYSPEEMGQSGYGTDSGSEDEMEKVTYFKEEKFTLAAPEDSIFGQVKSLMTPTGAVDIQSKKDKGQVKNGAKLAERIGKVPLSKAWHLFSEFFPIAVFIANVVVAIMDIVLGPESLYYKVSALVFGVIENIILIIMWLITRHPKFKKSDDYKTHLKRMQWAENIMAEILTYITIIITIFGFSTEKMYSKPNEAFGWAQLILLILDVLALVYTQVMRMYILYKLMKDLIGVIYPDDKTGGYMNGRASFAGYLLPRAHLTIAGNLVLLFIIGGMLGGQVWKDNYTSSNYRASLESGLILTVLILIPIVGNILFVLVNMYWVMEMFVSLNVAVGSDAESLEKLGKEYGEVVAGTLEFTQKKFVESKTKLVNVEHAKTWQKLLYGLTEVWILFLIFFYTVLTALAIYFFDGYTQRWVNIGLKILFVVVSLIANGHLVMLMFLSIFAVILFVISTFIYPLTIPLCCRTKDNIVDKFKRLRNKPAP